MRETLCAVLGALLFSTAGCGGPTFVFPGGALEGNVAATPASFAFAAATGTIELETRPEDPYSVNIACVVLGDTLYVSAGDNLSQWVENMQANPNVRARIEGRLYELRAERVTDDDEMRRFGAAWTEKISFGRDPSELDVAFVFRLGAR